MRLFHIPVPYAPDLLKAKSTTYWPVENKYPTPSDVRAFVEDTRGKPGIRLNVLSGLRSYSISDSQPIVSWFALFLTLMVALTAMPMPELARAILYVGLLAVGFLLIARIAEVTTAMDVRRRMTAVWLAAYEDGIRVDKESGPL